MQIGSGTQISENREYYPGRTRDRVLARYRRENGAALLRVQAQVVDHVAADLVEPRLVAAAPIHPVGAATHCHAILADVPHLVGGDQGVAVVIRQKDSVSPNRVEQAIYINI